jgi:hypothetical protein
MRYLLATAIITVLLATPSRAQMSQAPEKTPLDLVYEKEKKDREDNERQYNVQMKRLKAQVPAASNSDPWKGVRSTGDANAKR